MTFARRLVAEGLGTGLLLATVVGSGIMGVALSDGNEDFLDSRAEISHSPNSLLVVRLDANGAVEWSRAYPPSLREVFRGPARVARAGDGYLIAATILDVVEPADFGRSNVLLVRTDAQGALEWTQSYGGLYDESVTDVEALEDGGFLISAWSDSMGDYSEAWMLRVGPDGRIAEGCQADLGRAAPISAQDADVARRELAPRTENEPPLIDVVGTNVAPSEPSDVIVARQCAGTTSNEPGIAPAGHTLNVNLTGSPAGVVTSVPFGIICGVAGGGTCSNQFADGTLVTLRVDPGSLSDFQQWGPGCEPLGGDPAVCTVVMDADKTVDVIFGSVVELTINGIIGLGTVTSTPAGIMCPGDCAAPFADGSTVTLVATPEDGYEFVRWSGDCSGESDETAVTMAGDRACAARFEYVEDPGPGFTITVQISNQGGSQLDRVVSTPPAISCYAGTNPFENDGVCTAAFTDVSIS